MDTLTTELPAVLGYIAVGAAIVLVALLTYLFDPDTRVERAIASAKRADRKATRQYQREARR